MTRPKVEPANRQRIAQACESCKKRKQKCNGVRPCMTCSKRDLECVYGPPHGSNGSIDATALKRSLEEIASEQDTPPQAMFATPVATPMQMSFAQSSEEDDYDAAPALKRSKSSSKAPASDPANPATGFRGKRKQAPPKNIDTSGSLRVTPNQEDEADVFNNPVMLQDPTGRLLYIGESASLSFLNLTRMIVENIAGPSTFTTDPNRHKIVEATMSIPHGFQRNRVLPDPNAAAALADSFYIHVNGFVDIIPHDEFMPMLDKCYASPHTADLSCLCLINLTFAVGLVVAEPLPGSKDEVLIRELRSNPVDQAEMFYLNAKELCDPCAGFEDADFWSIQALTLTSIYMLAVSKRNTAFVTLGMAVRLGIALGLHRDETYQLYCPKEQANRRNLWRTMFVLDRFLATSLGRPVSIRESDCSSNILSFGDESSPPMTPLTPTTSLSQPISLEAAVRSSHVIGEILERIYSKRKTTAKIAQEIADSCKGWQIILEHKDNFQHNTSAGRRQSTAILHVDLLFCHSIILLTRPFFIYVLNRTYSTGALEGRAMLTYRQFGSLERLANACVGASSHSIALIHAAHERKLVPHRNPFILYFLFSSALVVIANEFSALFLDLTAYKTMNNAITVMEHFAQQDAQGSRLLFILNAFRDVAMSEQASRARRNGGSGRSPMLQETPLNETVFSNSHMENLFGISGRPPVHHFGPLPPLPDIPIVEPHSAATFPHMMPHSPAHIIGRMHHDSAYHSNGSSYQSNDSFHDYQVSPHNSMYSLENFMHSNGGEGVQHGAMPTPGGGPHSDGSDSTEIDFDQLWKWPFDGSLSASRQFPIAERGLNNNRGSGVTNGHMGSQNYGLGISNGQMVDAIIAPVMHHPNPAPAPEMGGHEHNDHEGYLVDLFDISHPNFHAPNLGWGTC